MDWIITEINYSFQSYRDGRFTSSRCTSLNIIIFHCYVGFLKVNIWNIRYHDIKGIGIRVNQFHLFYFQTRSAHSKKHLPFRLHVFLLQTPVLKGLAVFLACSWHHKTWKFPWKHPQRFLFKGLNGKKYTHNITAWDHELNWRVHKRNTAVKHRVVLVNIFNKKILHIMQTYPTIVGGWTNPFWKICESQIGSFHQKSGWN